MFILVWMRFQYILVHVTPDFLRFQKRSRLSFKTWYLTLWFANRLNYSFDPSNGSCVLFPYVLTTLDDLLDRARHV